MRGILFELPHTNSRARRTVETMGLSARDELLLQALLKRVPASHMPTFVPRLAWSERRASLINFHNCRRTRHLRPVPGCASRLGFSGRKAGQYDFRYELFFSERGKNVGLEILYTCTPRQIPA
jgi:hypothetical protein